jgi:hypothetical protein
VPSFQLSFGFLWVYMLTFALAELFCAEDLRRSTIPTRFRSMFVTTNTVLFFVLATLTLRRYDDMYAHRDMFLLAYAIVLGLIGFGYLRLRKADPLYNVYFTKAVSAFTLFLAVRFGQGTLTASLAIESVVLLYSSRRSGLVVTRALAFGAALLSIAHGLFTVVNVQHVAFNDPNYWRCVIESAFAVVGLFTASQMYQRTDWSIRSPRLPRFSRETLDLLWDMDFVAEPGTPGRKKPFDGLQFPYVYALGAGLLFAAYTIMLASPEHRMFAYASFILVVTVVAAALQARPFGLVAMLALVPAVVSTIVSSGINQTAPLGIVAMTIVMLGAASVYADRRITGMREGLAFHQMRGSPYFLYCSTAFILIVLIISRIDGNDRAAQYLAIAGAVATALITFLHRRALATAAIMLLAFGTLMWVTEGTEASVTWHTGAIMMAAACVFANRFFARGDKETGLAPWSAIALILTWPLVFRFTVALGKENWWFDQPEVSPVPLHEGFGYFHADWVPFVLALFSFAYAGYAALTRSRTSVAISAFNAVIVSLGLVTQSYSIGTPMATTPMLCGFLSLALFWAVCERLVALAGAARFKTLVDPICRLCVTAASLLLLIMLERVLSNYVLTIGWGVLAMVLFGISLLTRQRFYRYAGLGVFMLAIARLFYDARNLEGVYRPLAFIGLAILMLIVSFGYYYASRTFAPRTPPQVAPANTEKRKEEPADSPGPPPIP